MSRENRRSASPARPTVIAGSALALRALVVRFAATERGNAVTTFLILTGCWAALMAAGVQAMTPKLTGHLKAVSAAVSAPGR